MRVKASETVSHEIKDGAGLVELDNPPVNAASHDLRAGLVEAMKTLETDGGVKVIAIYGAGRAFMAGADIREFGRPPRGPALPDVCLVLENCRKPVIAVLHGPTLGGGLEVALSAHARVALPDLKTGFPEVTLGVIPGAGGTQRGPRLIGIPATLELATSGRRVGADEALSLRLVDRIVKGAPRSVAIASAGDAMAGRLATRRTGEIRTVPDPDAIASAARAVAEKRNRPFSPRKAVEAVAASTKPLAEGLAAERALFAECIASPQRAGLIHAFFSERAVSKIPERDAIPRDVGAVGVVGGGTMGSGIATAALLAGFPVTVTERDDGMAERARATVERNLSGSVKRGKLDADRRDSILADMLRTTADPGDLADADLVIEAVFEDMDIKRETFGKLEGVCKPGAVLATNTSYLDIDEIASATSRPQDVIGLHFFSPAHVMRLLEVVVAERTAPDVVATGFDFGKRLRKVAVRAGVCDGFIGNRILSHCRKVADYLVMDGATPYQVDRAMVGFGFAMGPFAVQDLAGLDIGWATRRRRAPGRDRRERYIGISDRVCEAGWFGRKVGRGYYLYDGGSRPNPDIEAIISGERSKAGVTARDFTDGEIVDRYMVAMVSEASRALSEGIALRPIDIDAVFLFGYGFPRHHGGPMHYADTIGATELVQRIGRYALEDAFFWRVPPLLREMAETGRSFADLNGVD